MTLKNSMDLRPNCLLTRYPIVFLHGLKTLLSFRNYWNGIPEYLSRHGYMVHECKAPWRGPHHARVEMFKDQILKIAQAHDGVHLIAHSLGALDTLVIMNLDDVSSLIKSALLVSPPFQGSPWADLGMRLTKLPLKPFKHSTETLTQSGAESIVKTWKKKTESPIRIVLSNPKFPVSPLLKTQHMAMSRWLKWKNLPPQNDGLVPLISQQKALQIGKLAWEFPGDHEQVIGAGPWPKGQRTAHEYFLDYSILLAEEELGSSK
ncbi:MAG: alpha/beta hydrolase [Oligoflexia bacterium]|nr:alpha/beta hydrolase [Oligoflexia bacterium]